MINVTKSDLPPYEKYCEYLKELWETHHITNDGKYVKLFEKKIKEYIGTNNFVVVSNGTIAIQLAIKALELKGEIITTPFTFAATTNSIVWENLKPVFADIDLQTYNLDPSDVEKKITDTTSAILAVHVYGNPCYVKELENIAEDYNLKLIFDAAHAFGVEYNNKSVFQYGDISTLSFHATKVFHSIEGGGLVVKDKELLDKIRLMRNHGIQSEDEIVLPGTNAKMNEFQAIMGICNLENIDAYIEARKKLYDNYKENLKKNSSLGFQKIIASKYNYSYMPLLFDSRVKRDNAFSELAKNGIKPRKYFFPLVTDFHYFQTSRNYYSKSLQNAKKISDNILCLPLYPSLEVKDANSIINIITDLER